MTTPAIKVEGLWKQYSVGAAQQVHGTFYDALSQLIRAPFDRLRKLGGESESADQFWALQDVNIAVRPGEVMGVIGRNGAGKSTLLKVLSRITAPTLGRVTVAGRMASLLEVGTGFHPELSGRENIFLNGAILGMTRSEVARKFDEIVAFAEVQKFIDTPVKRYSSGMYVRLAFGVAASLDVDVLLVDEVLAVGDTSFQEKCMAKLDTLSTGGRTILFVSHNLGAISRLCSRAVVLNAGTVAFDGPVSDALANYSRISRNASESRGSAGSGPLANRAKLIGVTINGSDEIVGNAIKPENEIEIKVTGETLSALRSFRVTVCVLKGDQVVLGLHDAEAPCDIRAGVFDSLFTIPGYFLSPGDYSVDVNMYTNATGEWITARGFALFSISTEWYPLYEPSHAMGIVNIRQSGQRFLRD
jgi:lipopolysaccharide transport system ATP-binding protein